MNFIRSVCLTLSRLTLSGWVFAAVLFVVTTVQEVSSPEIEAATKAHLTDMRFPAFYSFGFTLLITGFVTGIIGCQSTGFGRGRRIAVAALAGASLLSMTIDYLWIYGPLRAMSADPLAARPAEFVTYHHASMQINGLMAILAFLAAAAVSWPGKCRSESEPTLSH